MHIVRDKGTHFLAATDPQHVNSISMQRDVIERGIGT